MKRFKDYVAEYNAAIKKSKAINPGHTLAVRRDVWIAFKWTEDVDFLPWREQDYTKLEILMNDDLELYNEVVSGLMFTKGLKSKN